MMIFLKFEKVKRKFYDRFTPKKNFSTYFAIPSLTPNIDALLVVWALGNALVLGGENVHGRIDLPELFKVRYFI